MSEYRFHLQKYRYGSKISCPNCGKSRCFVRYVDEEGIIGFRTRWANVTMKTPAGIITHRESISGTIPMCSLNRTAAEPIVASCQGLPSVKRPIPFPLLSPSMWSDGACRTMRSTPCIASSARHSERRRLSICSGYTASAPHPNGVVLPSSGRRTGQDRYGPGKSCCTIPLPGIG